MAFALVNNVNTSRSRRADFDIHASGCMFVHRIAATDIEWVDVPSVQDVIAYSVQDLQESGFDKDSAESFTYYTHDCVKQSESTNNKEATMPTVTTKKSAAKSTPKTTKVTFDLERLPKGNGGVRFKERVKGNATPLLNVVYVSQEWYKANGEPESVTLTLSAA